MRDYYLCNGVKMPKFSEYQKKFGINANTFYTVDKLRFKANRLENKRIKEVNKKASEYASKTGWGMLPPSKK